MLRGGSLGVEIMLIYKSWRVVRVYKLTPSHYGWVEERIDFSSEKMFSETSASMDLNFTRNN